MPPSLQPPGLVLALTALLALALAPQFGCGGSGQRPEAPGASPPVVPFTGFFQGQLGQDIFLFVSLEQKQQFDIDPGSLTYTEFITRTGRRVYVANGHEELVESIAAGYAKAVDTALFRAGSLGAPPPATPRSELARRVQRTDPPAPDPDEDTRFRPPTVDELGPTGDQPPREGEGGD